MFLIILCWFGNLSITQFRMSVQPEDKKYVAIETTSVKHFIAQLGTRLKWKPGVKGQHLQLSGCLLLKQIYFTHTDVFPLDTFSIRNDNFFWNTTSERKVWFLTKTCMTKSLGLNSYSMLGVSWQQTALSFIATFKKHTKMVQVTIKDKHREGRNKQRNISHITYCISLLCWNKQAHQR